jgi:hypothetical protein
MRVLSDARLRMVRSPVLLDPYCGRGTSLFAARLRGIAAYGMDIAPVAAAITEAKLIHTTPRNVLDLAKHMLMTGPAVSVPQGEFWSRAFHAKTLANICKIRRGLFSVRLSNAATALRAIMLGALHGPQSKDPNRSSYFSNQMPRTFAAKPAYAVRYWKANRLRPRAVDVLAVIERRVLRTYGQSQEHQKFKALDVRCGDSRKGGAFDWIPQRISHVVTSPPYFGLRTYSQDQWLREWFLGGPPTVDYSSNPGLDHTDPESFAESLSMTWNNIGARAHERLRMYVRFGGIESRYEDSEDILRNSLEHSVYQWRVLTKRPSIVHGAGKRQALQMRAPRGVAEENDYVIALN